MKDKTIEDLNLILKEKKDIYEILKKYNDYGRKVLTKNEVKILLEHCQKVFHPLIFQSEKDLNAEGEFDLPSSKQSSRKVEK